jgi:hypothetical protein
MLSVWSLWVHCAGPLSESTLPLTIWDLLYCNTCFDITRLHVYRNVMNAVRTTFLEPFVKRVNYHSLLTSDVCIFVLILKRLSLKNFQLMWVPLVSGLPNLSLTKVAAYGIIWHLLAFNFSYMVRKHLEAVFVIFIVFRKNCNIKWHPGSVWIEDSTSRGWWI